MQWYAQQGYDSNKPIIFNQTQDITLAYGRQALNGGLQPGRMCGRRGVGFDNFKQLHDALLTSVSMAEVSTKYTRVLAGKSVFQFLKYE